MNSNRKRNLKKLARNIITTTAMASSLNSAGTNATEAQSSPGFSKSAIMTSAALLAGCAGIAGLNYYSDRKRTEADDKHRQKMYQLKKEEADMRLKLAETKQLLEKYGLNAQQITNLANGINHLRELNECQSFITTDDVIEALKTGGPTTIQILRAMIRNPGAADVGWILMMNIADKLNADNEKLGKVETALRTLIQNTNSREEVCNSLLEVRSGLAFNNFYRRWDDFAPAGGDPAAHLGLNGVNGNIELSASLNEFTFRQSNYDAGTQLLPDALKPLFGDVLWCGVACGRPSNDPNYVGALDLRLHLQTGPEELLRALAGEQAKKTIQTGEMPMYLVLSTFPYQRNNGFLPYRTRKLVPLFENSIDNRGGKDKTDLRKIVGNWLVANAGERLSSDRIGANNGDFT